MAEVWPVGTYMDNLKGNLEAREDLSGVKVVTAPLDPKEEPLEAIVLLDATASEDFAALGGDAARPSRTEAVTTIRGVIRIIKAGAGETRAKAARDRVLEVFAELETEIRAHPRQDLPTGTIWNARIAAKTLDQGVRQETPSGREAAIGFDISFTDRTNVS